jgi:ABC-type multidrug transport system fused ATPase/permease subunit
VEEPLATVEGELDAVLNHMAYDLLPTATVLTITNQMKHVVHCDKIMVVEGGKVCIRDLDNSSWQLLSSGMLWHAFCCLDEPVTSIHRVDK